MNSCSEVLAANIKQVMNVLENGYTLVAVNNDTEQNVFCELLALYDIPVFDEGLPSDGPWAYMMTGDGMLYAGNKDLIVHYEGVPASFISPEELKSRLSEVQLLEDENIL